MYLKSRAKMNAVGVSHIDSGDDGEKVLRNTPWDTASVRGITASPCVNVPPSMCPNIDNRVGNDRSHTFAS